MERFKEFYLKEIEDIRASVEHIITTNPNATKGSATYGYSLIVVNKILPILYDASKLSDDDFDNKYKWFKKLLKKLRRK